METPTFMEIIDKHTDGLTKNLRAFQEVYDNHEKALKDHDLTPVYVNLTEPIEQLRDEIDQGGHTTLPRKFWAILTTSPGVCSPTEKGIIHLPYRASI